MEKRLVSFMLAAALVMLAYAQFQILLAPPPAERVPPGADAEGIGPDEGLEQAPGQAGLPAEAGPGDDPLAEDPPAPRPPVAEGADTVAADPAAEADGVEPLQQYVVLGSMDPASPYQMAVILNNRGAAIERVELNSMRYLDLNDDHGYLGHLALQDDPLGGCRIRVVVPGSPAALAVPLKGQGPAGLRGPSMTRDEPEGQVMTVPGDRLIRFGGQEVENEAGFARLLSSTRPGQSVDLEVMRSQVDGSESPVAYRVQLAHLPLALIAPQPWDGEPGADAYPNAFLLTLASVGNAKVGLGKDEIGFLPTLWHAHWDLTPLPPSAESGPGIEFRRRLKDSELAAVGVTTQLEVVKRYRLYRVDRSSGDDPHGAQGYALDFEIALENAGSEAVQLSYQLDGPTGLPLEGWWYSYKVHPTSFAAAGARDIVWKKAEGKHEMFVGSKITKNAQLAEKGRVTPLAESSQPVKLGYAGGDAQYFAVALLPADDASEPADGHLFQKAVARAVGPLDLDRKKRTDVTFRLVSRNVALPPGETFRERFTIFAGPKQGDVLAHFGLEEFIVFGWFGAVAKPMLAILHFFHSVIASWGLSIVMLTVLVRGCMFPLGRKMALNAQKMQELAPEMKKIAEKYKNDLEKRQKEQSALFARHNYNPFAGCLVMFIQLPIFIGLYRSLSVDIALRRAPFFPGMRWCSNLAGPDFFWHWEHVVPAFLSSPTGWLGPYLNILPLITVGLFLVQQQLFTPPPQDDQQKMQQQIMKFMMLFMGVLFHKVAAGLCVYFIASSLWGIAERKLLPKSAAAADTTAATAAPAKVSSTGNGAVRAAASTGGAATDSLGRRRRSRKK